MEAARLGLQDFQLGGFSGAILGRGHPPPPPPPLGLGLPFGVPPEPWAAAAAAALPVPGLSGLSSLPGLPGFLANPQVRPNPLLSYYYYSVTL